MAYKLTQYHLDIINKNLPPQLAAFKERYPSTVFNAADHWNKPKFPQGYVPKRITIYYQESAPTSAITWHNNRLKKVLLEEIPVSPDVTQVMVDNIWTYICIQHQVFIDRTEGVQFPPELTHHELMLKKLVHAMSSGNYKEFQG